MKILETYIVWLSVSQDLIGRGFLYECENNKWYSHRVNQIIELTEEEAKEILINSKD